MTLGTHKISHVGHQQAWSASDVEDCFAGLEGEGGEDLLALPHDV
ncbi:MAG: hypothetical protein QOD49_422, partial [Actinomycetota bacterium]|nr:hypothetical protein [Actinomycetota bacterium]